MLLQNFKCQTYDVSRREPPWKAAGGEWVDVEIMVVLMLFLLGGIQRGRRSPNFISSVAGDLPSHWMNGSWQSTWTQIPWLLTRLVQHWFELLGKQVATCNRGCNLLHKWDHPSRNFMIRLHQPDAWPKICGQLLGYVGKKLLPFLVSAGCGNWLGARWWGIVERFPTLEWYPSSYKSWL